MKLQCFVSLLSAFLFVNKTKWFSGLHLVVVIVFWLFCVHFFGFIWFFHSFSKRPKNGHSKYPKNQNAKREKKDQKKVQLAQLCSQMVFLFFGGGQTNIFAENPIKIVVSTNLRKGKKGQTCEKGWVKFLAKVESKICPSMLRNIIGQMFDSKNGKCLSSFSFVFWKIAFSLEKEEYFSNKRK